MLRTPICLTFAVALANPSPASALDLDLAGFEFSVNTTRTTVLDDDFGIFDSDSYALRSAGIRVTKPISDKLAVVGAIRHGARGATLQTGSTEDWEDEGDSSLSVAITADTLSAGTRYTVWGDSVKLYGLVQAHGLRSGIRLDDDTVHNDNATQVRNTAVTAGASADIGLSADLPLDGLELQSIAWMELGYIGYLPLSFSDMGTLNLSGPSFSIGLGLRF